MRLGGALWEGNPHERSVISGTRDSRSGYCTSLLVLPGANGHPPMSTPKRMRQHILAPVQYYPGPGLASQCTVARACVSMLSAVVRISGPHKNYKRDYPRGFIHKLLIWKAAKDQGAYMDSLELSALEAISIVAALLILDLSINWAAGVLTKLERKG